MDQVRYLLINVVDTLLRVLPLRTKTGLIRIGNPGRSSPVLVTCNYHLTVERVKRALKGMDLFVLVANSRGVNVWCAATGGMFTHHDCISVLKTSGIQQLVDHREVILPQLAATGVDGKVIKKETGWKAIWGPVDIRDVPAFLKHGLKKTSAMKEVTFGLLQRVEIAISWAFPISVVFGLVLLFVWKEATVPAAGLIFGLSVLIFVSFPLYRRWLDPRGKRTGFVFFDFGPWGVQLIILAIALLGLVTMSWATGNFNGGFLLRWGLIILLANLLLSIDIMGSTPLYKSGLHGDRNLDVVLDEQKCKGAGFCEEVCPRNCYEVDRIRRKATRPRSHLCVQCGACIVQCPFDALFFGSSKGEIIPPEAVRKFKLNMMGKRLVNIE